MPGSMVYTQQDAPVVGGYGARSSGGSSTIANIANMLATALAGNQEAEYRGALTRVANEQATDAVGYRDARRRLGEMIAQQFTQSPIAVKNRVMNEFNTDPAMRESELPEATAHAQQTLVESPITPDFIGRVLGERVQAGDASAAGGDIGDILANAAVGVRDADLVSGFRGQALAPGQSVFQSDADRIEADREAATTSRNDADNATTLRGQDMQLRGQLGAANISAGVQRERIAQDDRATQAVVEAARASRLDQQTINAAVNQALGVRNNSTPPGPANYRTSIMARTAELLRQNPNIDASTAAAIAVQELLVEEPASDGFLGMGRHGRRYGYTDEGENYRAAAPGGPAPAATPSPAAAPAAGGLPAGAMIDDQTGEVFDAQGRLIGRVPR